MIAVSRSAEQSGALGSLRARHGNRLALVSADITTDSGLAKIAERTAAETSHLHLVIDCAGLLHADADGLRPEKSLTALRRDSLLQSFSLNTFAPILLIQALMPLLRHKSPLVLAMLSARVGSIGDNNKLGGWYAYRASKAAQNQMFRTLSIELRRTHPAAACVLLHPGTVDTPLSRPFQENVPAEKLFTPQRAARQQLDIIGRLTAHDGGRFIAWDGTDIPW